ncbi:sarcosine oxidase subunit gamma [Rhodopseudomonas sp. B29]|uniref:sarcosine oxidase subunit gamma n=1 Tax=Rhodopseudomonas sp. B29 TaxID=95607 RepID=UPI00034501B0|nr:sarcosine oxidase subunit gamma family protein [Rhodopseudomonas sp. B29]
MADLAAQPVSASFAPPRSALGDGVSIIERLDLALATVQVRRGQRAALSARINESYQLALPNHPAIASVPNISFVGLGPEHWLAMSSANDPAFVATLKTRLAGLASVSDQSGGYVVFRVGGRAIGAVLAKGFPIDLDPKSFQPGDAATTVVSHIGATIWRCADGLDGRPVFEISLFRSLAESFLEWFWDSAAEFGCRFKDPVLSSPSPSR